MEMLTQLGAATSVVVVTHDPEVAAWADRRLELRDGELRETTSVTTTATEPASAHPVAGEGTPSAGPLGCEASSGPHER